MRDNNKQQTTTVKQITVKSLKKLIRKLNTTFYVLVSWNIANSNNTKIFEIPVTKNKLRLAFSSSPHELTTTLVYLNNDKHILTYNTYMDEYLLVECSRPYILNLLRERDTKFYSYVQLGEDSRVKVKLSKLSITKAVRTHLASKDTISIAEIDYDTFVLL